MSRGLIGVPCREQGRWTPFWQCLDRLERPGAPGEWRLEVQPNNSVAYARNVIAQKALDEERDWVFFLDDDLEFSPDVLLKLLERDEDIVIGLSMSRFRRDGAAHCAHKPLWSNRPLDWSNGHPIWTPIDAIALGPNGLMPLTSGTGGGVLIRTSVFRTLPPLWWTIGQIRADCYFEDIWFYQRCVEAGIPIWGDPTVRFGHIHHVTLWPHQDADGTWSTVVADGFTGFLKQPWPVVRSQALVTA